MSRLLHTILGGSVIYGSFIKTMLATFHLEFSCTVEIFHNERQGKEKADGETDRKIQ